MVMVYRAFLVESVGLDEAGPALITALNTPARARLVAALRCLLGSLSTGVIRHNYPKLPPVSSIRRDRRTVAQGRYRRV